MVLLMLPHFCMEGMVHIQLVPSCRPLHALQRHVMPLTVHWVAVKYSRIAAGVYVCNAVLQEVS